MNNQIFDPFKKKLVVIEQDAQPISIVDLLKSMQTSENKVVNNEFTPKVSMPVIYVNNVIHVDFKFRKKVK